MVGVGTSTPSDERSGEGARGKGRQHPPPFSPPAGERKGAGGKVRAASRAPQYQRCNQCTPVPSIKMRARGPRSQHATIACAGHHAFAPAPPRPPFRSPCGRGREPGEGEGAPSPFLAPSGGEEGGWGEGEGRQACAPSTGAATSATFCSCS